MMSQLSLEKNFEFSIKIEFCKKKWIWMKNLNFEQKNSFFIKFQKSTKNGQKSSIFSKKIKTLFCFKITSICRKLILRLVAESSESTPCVYEAWNAPKSNLALVARLKAQKYTFSAKISRILDFQNSKLARLKPVNKNKALTCTIRSYDPKHASPMISSHSDCFRALNAPKRANFKSSKIKNPLDFASKMVIWSFSPRQKCQIGFGRV